MEVFSPVVPEKPDDSPEDLASLHRGMHARVLAESVVGQLLKSGYPPGEVVRFVSEALRALNGHLSREGEDSAARPQPNSPDREVIRCQVVDGHEGEGGLRVEGSRVYLRPVTREDVGVLTKWKDEPTIRATFLMRTLTSVIADIDGGDESAGKKDFIVCLDSDGPIGMVCLQGIEDEVGQAEMTKLIGEESARGCGYAFEATLLLLAYAFDTLNLQRVYIRTAGINMRNIRLNEQIGFQYEGVQRSAIRIDGELSNIVLMGILDLDFRDRYTVDASSLSRH